jgi:hypothetical protein
MRLAAAAAPGIASVAAAALLDKLRATLPSAREMRVLGAGTGSCPPVGVGRVH